jgi:hypothetical protein
VAQVPDIVTAIRNRLRDYRAAQANWAKEARENIEYISGTQLTSDQIDKLKARAQTPTVINILFQVYNQAVAMLTANDPKFQATAREDSDTQIGRLGTYILDWIWYNSRGKARLKQGIQDNYTTDRGILHAYIDPQADFGQGEVMVASGVPWEYYPDPHCRDSHWRDASHILVHRVFTGSQIMQKYNIEDLRSLGPPETEFSNDEYTEQEGLNAQVIGPDQHTSMETENHLLSEKWSTIEDYSMVRLPYVRITEIPTQSIKVLNQQEAQRYFARRVYRVTEAEGTRWELDEDDVLELDSLFQVYGPVFHWIMGEPKGQDPQTGELIPGDPVPVEGPAQGSPGEIPDSTVQLEPFTMEQLVAMDVIYRANITVPRCRVTTVIGQTVHSDMFLECDDYPIKPIVSNHTGNPYSTADITQVKGLQDQINKIHALTIAHAASSTNLKVFLPRGSVDKRKAEQQFGKAGVGIIEFDPTLGQPVVAQPAPLPNQLFANLDRNYALVDRLFGVYPFQQGDVSNAPETYKGTILMDENGMRRIKSKTNDVEESLCQLGRVCLQLAQSVYQHEKVIRLVQPNGSSREVAINVPYYDEYDQRLLKTHNDITRYHYDVIVVAGSTLPSSRWALLEMYMQLYRDGIIDQQEVLMKADVFDAPEILDRFGQMSQLQNHIAQLEQQLKAVQGDLQTAQREAVHARQETELARFREKLNKTETQARSSAQLFESRLNDILSQEKSAVNGTNTSE